MKRSAWFWVSLTVVATIIATVSISRDAHAQGDGPGLRGPTAITMESTGDLAVVDGNGDAILRIAPSTGDRMLLSDAGMGTGPNFSRIEDIAVDASSNFLIVDRNLDAVVMVDSETGDRRIVSGCPQAGDPCPVPLIGSGPPFSRLVSIAVENRESWVVVDFDARAVLRVDAFTGNRALLSDDSRGDGPALEEPMGIAVLPNGFLALADFALDAVVQIHPVTGDRTILSGCPQRPDPCPEPLVGNGPFFMQPIDVVLRTNRILTVIDIDRGALIDVNLETGNRSTVSDADTGIGPAFLEPLSLTADRNRRLYVADQARRAIIQVNPASGTRTILSQAPAMSISPADGLFTALQSFDLVLIVEGVIDDVSILSASLNVTEDVTEALTRCSTQQRLTGHGIVLRCANANSFLGLAPGRTKLDVRLNASVEGGDDIVLRDTVVWHIVGEAESISLENSQGNSRQP